MKYVITLNKYEIVFVIRTITYYSSQIYTKDITTHYFLKKKY